MYYLMFEIWSCASVFLIFQFVIQASCKQLLKALLIPRLPAPARVFNLGKFEIWESLLHW